MREMIAHAKEERERRQREKEEEEKEERRRIEEVSGRRRLKVCEKGRGGEIYIRVKGRRKRRRRINKVKEKLKNKWK